MAGDKLSSDSDRHNPAGRHAYILGLAFAMYCGAVYCIPQQSSGTSVHVVKLLLLLSDGTMRPSAFLFVVLVHSATADVTTLKPFQHVNRELLELDTGVKPYRLAGLKPSTGYEVRLSWPASVRSKHVTMVCDSKSQTSSS